MGKLEQALASYKAACRQALDTPAPWVTAEAKADGLEFLDAWDEWEELTKRQRAWHRESFIGMMIFMFGLPWYFRLARKVDAAYARMDAAQRRFNEHHSNYQRRQRELATQPI